jgi:tyrosyl-tRNA synthetase
MTPSSTLLQTLQNRGLIHQVTDFEGLDELAVGQTLVAYAGFDPTGPSLHVGHLIAIMMLRILQKTGHKPIVILGGGTSKIGDPTGKDEARQLLTDETILQNIQSLKKQLSQFLTFGDGPTDAILLNNDDWFKDIKYIDFLRDYGRHFSVNRMLTFDSVRMRLEREQPLSFLEFNYSLLQAYDFMILNQKYNCVLQLGGADQWGNIVSGIDLTRRICKTPVYGLTSPLLTTSSGTKMGKTAKGAVWIGAEYLSPYDYFQFWRNIEDGDVIKFLKLFTDLPLETIQDFEKLEGQDINQAKVVLATEATAMCHGRTEAEKAKATAEAVFIAGGMGEDLQTLEIEKTELTSGFSLLQALTLSGLTSSLSEGRRLIRGKGCRVNNTIIEDENKLLTLQDLDDNQTLKISSGKKKHVIYKFVN